MSSSSRDQKLSHISGACTWRYTCLFMCAQHIAKPYSQLALHEVSVWSLEMKGGFKGVQRAMKGAGSLVTYTKCVYVHACLYIYVVFAHMCTSSYNEKLKGRENQVWAERTKLLNFKEVKKGKLQVLDAMPRYLEDLPSEIWFVFCCFNVFYTTIWDRSFLNSILTTTLWESSASVSPLYRWGKCGLRD